MAVLGDAWAMQGGVGRSSSLNTLVAWVGSTSCAEPGARKEDDSMWRITVKLKVMVKVKAKEHTVKENEAKEEDTGRRRGKRKEGSLVIIL